MEQESKRNRVGTLFFKWTSAAAVRGAHRARSVWPAVLPLPNSPIYFISFFVRITIRSKFLSLSYPWPASVGVTKTASDSSSIGRSQSRAADATRGNARPRSKPRQPRRVVFAKRKHLLYTNVPLCVLCEPKYFYVGLLICVSSRFW